MVWIETNTGDGVLNDERIERIFCEPPNNLNQMFHIYAEISGKTWLIYAGRIPTVITAQAKDKEITDEMSPQLIDWEIELFNKVMYFINNAKTKNNNQVISLRDEFEKL